MCGILGIAATKAIPEHWPIETMRDQMRHRGPDAAGLWWADDRRVVLAHRRLAIIDLSPRGHQPMHDTQHGLHIVFNGEIYNYRDLRERLQALGHHFATESDTEVLLAAYRQWGSACVEELNGMFAFAIYDQRKPCIFAARDRAGEKPFFYWHRDGRFWFASELKALLAHPEFPRQLDVESLEFYLTYGYVPGERCILQGVRKLPPACALLYDLAMDRVQVWRYWQLPQCQAEPTVSPVELVKELEFLLEQSVRRQLVADVPVGILLSGGVDSSLITAMAARCSSEPVRTFTISFPGHGIYDEAPFARRVAQHFGTKHTELQAEPSTVELLPLLAAQYDEPIADSSMIPTYMVSRLIRQHATVALGGDGGDELFGGYKHYSVLVSMGRVRPWLPVPAYQMARAVARSVIPLGVKGRNALLAFLSEPDRRFALLNTYFDAGSRDLLLAPLRAHVKPLDCEKWKEDLARPYATVVQKATAADFLSYLPEDILVKVDRASMLASLEMRAPFLDRTVIEFAFARVPDSLRATSSQRKVLTRRLAEKLLPPDLDTTRKQGFSIPLDAWFRNSWGNVMTDILEAAPRELFNPRAIRRLIDKQYRGANNAHRLFALTIFELWRRHYRISL